jgi:hypothetical protein
MMCYHSDLHMSTVNWLLLLLLLLLNIHINIDLYCHNAIVLIL